MTSWSATTRVMFAEGAAPNADSPSFLEIESMFDYFRVESITVNRGRRDEHEKTATGTATINANTRSVSLTQFIPAQIRVDLWDPVDESYTPIFQGSVIEAEWEIDPIETVARVALSCVDALDYLAGYELSPDTAGHPGSRPEASDGNVFYEDAQVDDRIIAALGDADWPSGMTEIFSGNVNVQETVYPPRTTALEVMQDAADAEFPGVSNIYASKTNVVTFHGRRARFFPDVAEYDIDEWKIGDWVEIAADSDGTAQIRGLGFSRSRMNIINAALATPQNIEDEDIVGQIFTDATSIGDYGLHSWSAENLITDGHKLGTTTALEETRKFAEYYVDNYKTPTDRVTNVVVRSLRPEDYRAAYTWRVMREVEISDIIHLSTTHPGPLYPPFTTVGFDSDFFVEGIRYEILPLDNRFDNITMTLDISPKALYTENPFDDDEAPS